MTLIKKSVAVVLFAWLLIGFGILPQIDLPHESNSVRLEWGIPKAYAPDHR